jgi:hypothetical protein
MFGQFLVVNIGKETGCPARVVLIAIFILFICMRGLYLKTRDDHTFGKSPNNFFFFCFKIVLIFACKM